MTNPVLPGTGDTAQPQLLEHEDFREQMRGSYDRQRSRAIELFGNPILPSGASFAAHLEILSGELEQYLSRTHSKFLLSTAIPLLLVTPCISFTTQIQALKAYCDLPTSELKPSKQLPYIQLNVAKVKGAGKEKQIGTLNLDHGLAVAMHFPEFVEPEPLALYQNCYAGMPPIESTKVAVVKRIGSSIYLTRESIRDAKHRLFAGYADPIAVVQTGTA